MFHNWIISPIMIARMPFVLLTLLCMLPPVHGEDPLADVAESQQWSTLSKWLRRDGVNVDHAQPDGMTALHWAVYHNQSTLVELLIRAKCNVNASTRYKVTPLSIAATHRETEIVKLLLEAGAVADVRSPGGETALMIAARTGNADSIRQLLCHKASLDATDKSGQTALMWAADAGNVEAVDALISAGANLDTATPAGFTAMMFASRDGNPKVVKRLIDAGVDVNAAIAPDSKREAARGARAGTSALIFAVESAHYELAMFLVAAGADPNDQRSGFAPLHVISWVRKPNSGDNPDGDPPPRGSGSLSDLQFVREIVAAGADVNIKLTNARGGKKASLNTQGTTPMLYAARTADVPLMKVLVDLGAGPLVPNTDGCTPLMAAAGVGVRSVDEEAGTEPEVVEAIDYLVSLGADVNTVDKNKETAMHGAAYRNFPLAVARLAKHGADPKVWDHKNKSGWTPFLIAQGNRPGSFKPSPVTEAALRAASVVAAPRRPNILIMYTDDQAQKCLGIMGNKHIQTPNMDRLAKRGVLFNNAFVTTAICCCNRACLLTGQHMVRHGIRDFATPLSAAAFDQTYPALLRQSGYRTGFLGKYAIGNPGKGGRELSLPADKFDFWYGFDQGIDFRQEVDGKPRYLTELMTDKAIEFLQSNKSDQPFCLSIAFKEPHGPFNYFDPNSPNTYADVEIPTSPTFTVQDFESQPDFIRKGLNATGSRKRLESSAAAQQELRTVYRLITRADQAVGKILDELERLKLDDNTVVIFTSDHGDLLGDHGLSQKWLMYEGSIRVPMIVCDPRVDKKLSGTRRDEMVLSIDLAPTMLTLAGLTPPASMHGSDMIPLVNHASVAWRKHFYYEHTFQTEPPRAPIPRSEGMRTDRWKYIRYPDTVPVFEQLFDLESDPNEQKNLAMREEYSMRLNELRDLCDKEPALLR